jgi:hypothetical protein
VLARVDLASSPSVDQLVLVAWTRVRMGACADAEPQ